MNLDLSNSAFPISIETTDAGQTVFKHKVIGGMTFKEYMAIEILKGLLSNPILKGPTIDQLEEIAIKTTNSFELKLRPDSTPIPNS